MARRVFYSFHYDDDNWRAAQIRNIGIIDGNRPARDNEWEEVTRGGDSAIERWIDWQMYGRSTVIVLIGSNTAGRKWINYEIETAWELNMAVLGIYIHGIKNSAGQTCRKGRNPFYGRIIDGQGLGSIVPCYDPSPDRNGSTYQDIRNNLEEWIEEAIEVRRKYA